jgi:hypothetical protein
MHRGAMGNVVSTGAHRSDQDTWYWLSSNRHVLYGGLIGGNNKDGTFGFTEGKDDDDDDGLSMWTQNDWGMLEIGTYLNAALTANLARLVSLHPDSGAPAAVFPDPMLDRPRALPRLEGLNPEGFEYWTAAVRAPDDSITLHVYNHSAWPATHRDRLTARIYLPNSLGADQVPGIDRVQFYGQDTNPQIGNAAKRVRLVRGEPSYIEYDFRGIDSFPARVGALHHSYLGVRAKFAAPGLNVSNAFVGVRGPHDKLWIGYRFENDKPRKVASYRVTSAADAVYWQRRDPTAWALEGSDDGRRWTLMDERTGVLFEKPGATLAYQVKDPRPYRQVRLRVRALRESSEPVVQLGDLTLLDAAGTPLTSAGSALHSGFFERLGLAENAFDGDAKTKWMFNPTSWDQMSPTVPSTEVCLYDDGRLLFGHDPSLEKNPDSVAPPAPRWASIEGSDGKAVATTHQHPKLVWHEVIDDVHRPGDGLGRRFRHDIAGYEVLVEDVTANDAEAPLTYSVPLLKKSVPGEHSRTTRAFRPSRMLLDGHLYRFRVRALDSAGLYGRPLPTQGAPSHRSAWSEPRYVFVGAATDMPALEPSTAKP